MSHDPIRDDPSDIRGPTPMAASASAVMMKIYDGEQMRVGRRLGYPSADSTAERRDGLMYVRHRLAAVILVAALPLLGGACSSAFRERMCSPGEHAVRAIEAPDTGRTCVKNGQPPPPRYEEFPPGHRPTYVDQDR